MRKRLKSRSGRELFAAILLAATAVGCQQSRVNSNPQKSVAKASPTIISVGIAREQPLKRTVEVPATLESDQTAKLMPRVEAYVGEVFADIGDEVEQGQLLVQLYAPELEQRVKQHLAAIDKIDASRQMTLAELKAAQSQNAATLTQQALRISMRDRLANLVSSGAIAGQRLEEAEATLGTTNAELEEKKNAIELVQAKLRKGEADLKGEQALLAEAVALSDYLKIKAPFAGVVAERNIDPGNLVRPSDQGSSMKPLLIVAKVDRLRAIVHATTDMAGQLVLGQAVQFVADDVPGKTFEGQLSRMAGAYDEKTRMMQAEVDLDNAPNTETGQRSLRAGSYGSATIILQAATLPVVPTSALRKRGDRTSVVVVRDGSCLVTPVEVAFASGDMVAIAAGVAAGDQVVENANGVKDEQLLQESEIKIVSW